MATIECVMNSHLNYPTNMCNTNTSLLNLNGVTITPTVSTSLPTNQVQSQKENIKKNSPKNNSKSKSGSKTKRKPTDETMLIKFITNSLPELDSFLTLKHKIGEGTFSSVFLASLKEAPDMLFAVKHLVPMSIPHRMETELRCMQEIGGQDNVVSCTTCFRNKDCIVFIMPYIAHKKFFDYIEDMDVEETRLYMKNLLLALRRVHSFNVIHRDIKPSNFLYDRKNKKFLLVDFGLSQFIKKLSPAKTPQNTKLTNNKRKRVEDPTSSYENRPKRIALAPRADVSNLIQPSPIKTTQSDIKTDIFNSKSLTITSTTTGTENQTETVFSPPRARNIKKRLVFNDTTSTSTSTITSNVGATPSININNLPEPQLAFQKLTPGTNASGNRTHMRLQNGQVQISFTTPFASRPYTLKNACKCFALPQVCKRCLANHPDLNAPRAGTPGFRPPEVLLKYQEQTTAVDIWAAGVILLSILSGRYPFFRAPDDLTALAEISTIFGFKPLRLAGFKMGRFIQSSHKPKNPDLRKLCQRLRGHNLETTKTRCKTCQQTRLVKDGSCICPTAKMEEENVFFSSQVEGDRYPDSAYDLLIRMMEIDPTQRISAEEALQHPFIQGC